MFLKDSLQEMTYLDQREYFSIHSDVLFAAGHCTFSARDGVGVAA
jgi:hypothetical protein